MLLCWYASFVKQPGPFNDRRGNEAKAGCHQKGLAASGKTDLGCSRLEEPVEAEAPVIPNRSLQLVPLPIAQQVHLAQDEPVLFLCVGLALVCAILQLQLL